MSLPPDRRRERARLALATVAQTNRVAVLWDKPTRTLTFAPRARANGMVDPEGYTLEGDEAVRTLYAVCAAFARGTLESFLRAAFSDLPRSIAEGAYASEMSGWYRSDGRMVRPATT